MEFAAACGPSVRLPGRQICPRKRRAGTELSAPHAHVTQFQPPGASKLPASCHYIDAGANSQTLVSCDLTAGDLLDGAADVRSYCQDKYADNIVVHVPIPAPKVTCNPSYSSSPYAGTCTAMPWVVTP